MDTETGELQERRLQHPEEAEKFYRELAAKGIQRQSLCFTATAKRPMWLFVASVNSRGVLRRGCPSVLRVTYPRRDRL
jgi:hypothetical protein